MTTKPKAQKFRIRRSTSATAQQADAPVNPNEPQPTAAAPAAADQARADAGPVTEGVVDSARTVAAETDMEAIRKEGLTGRQLRMARRVAQKQGLAVTSDFDAVRQLRARGIDPFQRSTVLELVTPADKKAAAAAGKEPSTQAKVQLPQTVETKQSKPGANVPAMRPAPDQEIAERRAGEIRRVQREIARRRRRNLAALFIRLAMFVGLPTFLAGYYFYVQATPMYGTKSEFIIQQADGQGGGAFGSLFQGSSLSTQADSVAVQSYLNSRDAYLRLNADHNFIGLFTDETLDPIQRLPADATQEEAYKVYQSHVQIGYDPTEGIIRMEVIAPDPQKSQMFSDALIDYAEDQVDQLTQRVRNDQMSGAQETLDSASQRREDALAQLVSLQEEIGQADPMSGSAALQQRITSLQGLLDQEQLDLASQLNVRRPNEAQVTATRNQITYIENQINALRAELSEGTGDSGSIVLNSALLRQAEENYAFEVANVQAAQSQLDTALIEANRQVRYLSVSVPPIAPDQATYPRAFENTLVSFLVFAGIYLMLSLTASILREQVSS